jgi:hypothetical protein
MSVKSEIVLQTFCYQALQAVRIYFLNTVVVPEEKLKNS